MNKLILPLAGLIVAGALFALYTKPTFDATREIEVEAQDYKNAIVQADALRERVNQLLAERSNFSSVDMARLETFLPGSVNIVRYIMSIDALAELHALQFGNIEIEDAAEEDLELRIDADAAADAQLANRLNPLSPNAQVAPTTEDGLDDTVVQFEETGPVDLPYRAKSITFTVTGTYEDFRGFVGELENSLVLTDVSVISLGSTELEVGEIRDFKITALVYEFIGIE